MTSRKLAIAIAIEERFGLKAPLSSVEKIRYRLMQEQYPFSRSMQALLAAYKAKCGGNDSNWYVISIVDERQSDLTLPNDQKVGVSIIGTKNY